MASIIQGFISRFAKAPTLSPQAQHLNQTLQRVSGAALRSGNSVQLLKNGRETYDEWLLHIAMAKKWVHLENYIFQNDVIGNQIADALIKKSVEGVKVRVLYDWFGCIGVKKSFWERMRKAGVTVRVINPVGFRAPAKILSRDHRKFLGVDGEYGSVGGVCIGDQWLETDEDTGLPFRDTAISIQGPAIIDLEKAFRQVWLSTGGKLPLDETPSDFNFPTLVGHTAVRVVAQEPRNFKILKLLEMVIHGAEKRLWLADAYFLAIPSLYQALLSAARDGVDVRILLPATSDIKWVNTLSRTGYRSLLEAGVRIWEYSGPMMHAKTTVIDGWWSRVGSTNFNFSSLYLNWEIDLVVEDREFGEEMERMYRKDLKNAREICLHQDKGKEGIKAEKPFARGEKRIKGGKYRGSGSKIIATAARVGTMALTSSTKALIKHERRVSLFITIFILLLGLLTLFFPTVIAYPLAVLLLFSGIVRMFRTMSPVKNS